MISICIIGSGNVAYHLFHAFLKSKEIEVRQLVTRTLKEDFPKDLQIHDYELIKSVDVVIISVSDDAIEKVASKVAHLNTLIVHTSGTSSIDVLNSCKRKGVFYPLQTFSKNKTIDFSKLPICLEAFSNEDAYLLEKLAKSISTSVHEISSEQRKTLHIAAVFVCNFVNHLYVIGEDICKKNKVPFEILKPLITETANKINYLNPKDAQTGPAIRNDSFTLYKHIQFIENEEYKKIYKLLTQSIQDVKKL